MHDGARRHRVGLSGLPSRSLPRDLVRRGTVDIVAVGRFGHEANEGRPDLGDRQGEVDVVSSQCVQRHHRDTRVTGILNDRGAPGVFDRAQALGPSRPLPERTTPMARGPHRDATDPNVTSIEGREKLTGGPAVTPRWS